MTQPHCSRHGGGETAALEPDCGSSTTSSVAWHGATCAMSARVYAAADQSAPSLTVIVNWPAIVRETENR